MKELRGKAESRDDMKRIERVVEQSEYDKRRCAAIRCLMNEAELKGGDARRVFACVRDAEIDNFVFDGGEK